MEGSQLLTQSRTADGHFPDASVTHLGFLGTRHTALVSANSRGMAFSHLATRGTGALGRSVKNTRILGRYPDDKTNPGKPRKPSTVLAFAPLPLGNVERVMDSLGLTAMLTPYLLVIVSTTPVAQTQHKAARPKEVEAHSAMSGCLAWFPAVKLKVKDPSSGATISKVKLVYCWSNVLTVLDVDEVESPDKDKPPSLFFKARSRWKSEEAIVAVQWISRSVLTVLTITQRLIILEDTTMRMTEGFDLIGKHIFHKDLFSEQLHNLVERLDEEDPSMHGVVADAFYMSFRAYKGRMFLLGFGDVSVGTLTNWADRLIALVEEGDYIAAILLANSYYSGDADKLTIGLPEDSDLRHSMVRDKLLDIMSASLKFAFKTKGDIDEKQLKHLAEACLTASLSLNDTDFLFDEAYEWYEDAGAEGIFLETLEPYILSKDISMIPPIVVKSMVTHYVTSGLESRLEDMICQMETATLDLDELTTLCKQHNLYDALIYVWNQALGDYITPLIDLLSLLIPLVQNGEYFSNGDLMDDPIYGVNALKMFPYLSYTFTGRRYPTGDALSEEDATNAKAELYWFLFSGKTITWPKGSGKKFLTRQGSGDEPSFPYLRMILKFDAPSFLSSLNEAFEDSFLNDSPDRAVNGGPDGTMPEDQLFGLTVNRQYIISILLEVMNPADFAPEDTIYLDMFIARNLPKFPQYLLLSGTSLHRVLEGLCSYPGDDIADDAQLSAEYLMSIYHPSDLSSLMPLFEKAGFFRVLKSIYRADKQYDKLLQTYFEDHNDQEDVFDCIMECLGPQSTLSKKQAGDVHQVLEAHAADLIGLDIAKTAGAIDICVPQLHQHFLLDVLEDEPEHQYIYLQAVLEPRDVHEDALRVTTQREKSYYERYVQLMCRYDAKHVPDYVNSLKASDLRLDKVLPAMENTGIIDAAVVLMAREGQIRDAMDRLTKHLGSLEAALLGLLDSPTDIEMSVKEQSAEDLLDSLQKYVGVGIWLCKNNAKSTRRASNHENRRASKKEDLLPDELLWLDLIDTAVQITKSVSSSLTSDQSTPPADPSTTLHTNTDKLLNSLRTLVQRTFTALLSSTTSPNSSSPTQSLSFLRILRAFLARASLSSPNLSDLRGVLSSIFSAYAYEESILSLANRLLDKDLFVNVKEANELRQRGWRPRGSVCEGCRRRVWGPGAIGGIYAKWEERKTDEADRREERRVAQAEASEVGNGRGKAAAKGVDRESPTGKDIVSDSANNGHAEGMEEESEPHQAEELGPLIVLACRHIYHQVCLEKVQPVIPEGDENPGREFRCPIDG